MKIHCVEIQNFRKLKSVRIDFSDKSTIFVGANNSGKTSAIVALGHFLVDPSRFDPKDFTLSNWQHIDAIGQSWVKATANQAEANLDTTLWTDVLPMMDVWLDVNLDEVNMVSHLIPTLDWSGGRLGVRLRFEPSDLNALFEEFVTAEKAARETIEAAEIVEENPNQAVKLWPQSLSEFLDRKLGSHFKMRSYLLDPRNLIDPSIGKAAPQPLPTESEPIDIDPFKGLILIREVDAQRGFTDRQGHQRGKEPEEDSASNHPSERYRLSRQLRSYYNSHIDPADTPEPSDIEALQAIHRAQQQFDLRLKEGLSKPLEELTHLGYPGITDPTIELSTKISPIDGLKHPSAVQYDVASANKHDVSKKRLLLPEDSLGLGYQNLIYMVFQLMRYRDAWMKVGKAAKRGETAQSRDGYFPPPILLVIVEEPEAHLHAQVQQVFIRHAYDVLRNHPELKENPLLTTQMVVSTHSSHIAHESRFSDLRYFRRVPAGVATEVPTSSVMNLTEVFGSGDETERFVTRYLRTTHCDLFFADAAILIEGTAERVMVPHFIRNYYPKLHERYVSFLEIAGSHAHRLRPLIETLRIPTLIVTDLDPAKPQASHSKARPCRGQSLITRNQTLKGWVPGLADLDSLLDLCDDCKVDRKDELFAVRVAYQCPTSINLNAKTSEQEILAGTFEDALVYQNLETFRSFDGTGPIKAFKDAINEATDTDELSTNLAEKIKKISKAEFALDLLDLENVQSLHAPAYITQGLKWLELYLDRTLRESIPPIESSEPTINSRDNADD